MITRSRRLAILIAMLAPWAQAAFGTDTPITPFADIRSRYEDVRQDPLSTSAVALTLRARLGLKTQEILRTSLLVEGNLLVPLIDNYRADNAVPSNLRYPVVADARAHYINRLQLTNHTLPDTTVTVGRQRIELDDQRFVGSAGWRQNEQTFDGVRVVNQSIANLTVDFSYIDKVHRVYGPDSPQGLYTGDIYLTNIGYQTPIGKLTVFSYLISLNPITSFPGLSAPAATALNPAYGSTTTSGGRFAGGGDLDVVHLGYAFSYATQHQRGDNPAYFTNDFYSGEVSARVGGMTVTGGDERSQGNGSIGFVTPLWSPHPFDGWADKFSSTPTEGLQNRYGSLRYQWRNVGPLRNITAMASYHNFAAEHGNADYGSELDWQLACSWESFSPSIMYANYEAAASTPITVARDTRKLFVQLEYHW